MLATRRLPAAAAALFCTLLLALAYFVPGPASADDSKAAAANGYSVDGGSIGVYFKQHGGTAALGAPISNPMQLLGRRVQIFQRQALEVRPDGSVGTLNLLDGDLLPLTAVGGPGMAADPALVAKLPTAGSPGFAKAAAAYLDANAPNAWNGQPVGFNAYFRSMLQCSDLVGVPACDKNTLLGLAIDLWGLPTGHAVPDPRTSDFVYLRFQRGVMVYSRSAGATQWLLLGELLKQVLLGNALPPEMLAQITASPTYSRLYAQYDPLARDGLARPHELPGTSLAGAFPQTQPQPQPQPQSQTQTQTMAAVAPAAAPPATAATPRLDTRFGVAEGFRNPDAMAEMHAGWERVVLPWDQIQPSGPGDFSHLGMTLPADRLRAEVARGTHVAGVLQFTPAWAQANPADGQRSVPKNLDLPFDDPNNYWGRFVYETVRAYAGQIDEWIIWNEPDIRPGDAAGGAYTWAGTDQQFARLMAVGYMAAKKANPKAVVSFPATSYWADETSNPKRTPFYDRILRILSTDARAAEHGLYHDAVALNLYRSPDDIYRVHAQFVAIQRRYGVDRPIWLTEMNAMPTDDVSVPCADKQLNSPIKTSMDQQANYALQSFALAAAAGYQHAEFYKLIDSDTCQEPAWGMLRADGSRRPVLDAARTALTFFSNFTGVHFAPLARGSVAWSSWPANPNSYLPNWQVYQVAFDRPGNQRVSALWNGDGTPLRVRVPKNGTRAKLVDRRGAERPAVEEDGAWVIDLPAAAPSAQADDPIRDPDGYHVIGGDPLLLVEEGVAPSAPVVAPKLA